MFNYLRAPIGVQRHRVRVPRWPYVQTGLMENLIKHQRYYRGRLQRVPSDHLLVRMIHGSPLPWSVEARPFLDSAKNMMYEVANSLDLTSNVSRGELQYPGPFYGMGVRESIMVHDTAFDTYSDWETLRPVRVHRHPVTGLFLQTLNGDERDAKGIASISINYPMLMWVYRCWRASDQSSIDDYELSIAHFVQMVVIPGMMEDHLDLVIFNRLYNDLFSLRDRGEDEKGSFYLIDYEDKLDGSLEAYLSQIGRKTLALEELLSSLPTIYHDTFYGVLPQVDVITNSQTMGWLWVSYLPVIKYWVAYDYLNDNRRNQTPLRELQRTLKRTLRSRWLSNEVERELDGDLLLIQDWLESL